jgi:hypothetical protein
MLWLIEFLLLKVFRSSLGFVFPLFGEQMFARLGLGGGNSLLAGLAIVLGIPFPIWIYYYGERIRLNSSLSRWSGDEGKFSLRKFVNQSTSLRRINIMIFTHFLAILVKFGTMPWVSAFMRMRPSSDRIRVVAVAGSCRLNLEAAFCSWEPCIKFPFTEN